jgi:site-specific recombinase
MAKETLSDRVERLENIALGSDTRLTRLESIVSVLAEAQQKTDMGLDQLTVHLDHMTVHLDQLTVRLDQLAAQGAETDRRLRQLAEDTDRRLRQLGETTDLRLRELGEATDRRISQLVIAMGEFIRQRQ